jgi:enoyl-CoA hydratase/carnithine racemase
VTQVLVELNDLVATVTLNRPERRNAISSGLLERGRSQI